jgi:hypothetical protein
MEQFPLRIINLDEETVDELDSDSVCGVGRAVKEASPGAVNTLCLHGSILQGRTFPANKTRKTNEF